ncbi:hypothetical protein TeGR_g5674, partial [Tetraparma gracilis]
FSVNLSGLSDMLEGHSHVFLDQKVDFLEAITMGIVEQANTYTVIHPTTMEPLMIVKEKSNPVTRCCCAPLNSLTLEFAPASAPGDVVYTAERPGCCTARPQICCFTCADSCADKMVLHKGNPQGCAGELLAPSPLLMVRQENAFESPFNPAFEIMPKGEGEEFLQATHKMSGPMCFGGCIELCCDSEFNVVDMKSGSAAGRITKLKPENMTDAAKEMLTDADRYRIDFGEGMSNETKAGVLTSSLLIDYMFFEQDLGVCKPKLGGGCSTTLFNCYCCGCICPCSCSTGDKKDEGGA